MKKELEKSVKICLPEINFLSNPPKSTPPEKPAIAESNTKNNSEYLDLFLIGMYMTYAKLKKPQNLSLAYVIYMPTKNTSN